MTFIKWDAPGETRYVPVSAITGVEYIDHGGMPMTMINTVCGKTYAVEGNAVNKILNEIKKTEPKMTIVSLN